MADERPPVYAEDSGLVVYRASALDLCPADLLAYRTGQEPAPFSEEQLERMKEGHLHEPDLIEWVKAKGFRVSYTGAEQLEIDWPVVDGVVIRGHPDGLARWWDDDLFTIECKALGKELFLKGIDYLTSTYRAQLSWEYLATLNRLLLVVKNRDSGRKKSYDFDAYASRLMSARELRQHVLNVEIAARLGRELECNRASRWFCRFPWRQMEPTPPDGAGEKRSGGVQASAASVSRAEPPPSDLPPLASALHRLREQQRGLHEEEQTVRDAVIAAMGSRKRVTAGEWKVRLTWQTRKGWNEKVLVERFGEEALSECRTESAAYPVVVVEAVPPEPVPTVASTTTSTDGASEPVTSS